MNTYAKALAAFLGVIEWVAKIFHDKHLMDAGEAKAESRFSAEQTERVKNANTAAFTARNADGVPDGFHRD